MGPKYRDLNYRYTIKYLLAGPCGEKKPKSQISLPEKKKRSIIGRKRRSFGMKNPSVEIFLKWPFFLASK